MRKGKLILPTEGWKGLVTKYPKTHPQVPQDALTDGSVNVKVSNRGSLSKREGGAEFTAADLPAGTGHDSAAKLLEAIQRFEFDTLLTTLNPVSRRQAFRDDLLPAANRKRMGVIAMKVMGGGNGCLALGNPLRKVLRPYHDETGYQVNPALLIRYTLSLPVSVAVIGVASVDQLKANVSALRAATPMALAERHALETVMG